MKPYTIKEAIADAFACVERKINEGKLISCSDRDYDWDNKDNYEFGDPENLYTILSLYSQFLPHPEDRFRLETALWEKYPEWG